MNNIFRVDYAYEENLKIVYCPYINEIVLATIHILGRNIFYEI